MCKKSLRLTCLLIVLGVLGWGGSAWAQAGGYYLLTGNSGGQLQIGTGLPLPIQTFRGGLTPTNGGTTCQGVGCQQSPDGPGTAYWPPLLVPADNRALCTMVNVMGCVGGPWTQPIVQNGTSTMGGAIAVKASALAIGAPNPAKKIAVFDTNPAVFQVATSISYEWPAASQTAVFRPGGAPGMVGTPVVLGTGISGGTITYSGSTKAFGGPAQFAIQAGPGAAGGRVGANATGQNPVASVWINFAGALPQSAMAVALVGASNPVGVAAPGANVNAASVTTMFGAIAASNGPFGAINVGHTTMMGGMTTFICDQWCVGTNGTIDTPTPVNGGSVQSFPLPSVTIPTTMGGTFMLPGLTNMVTNTMGFPWTTGLITLSQGAAVPPEIFWLSGTDMRVNGVGNISLVSGALSTRHLSGPNGNRGWLTLSLVPLPEPTAALGAAAALAVLGLCHGLVRRRRAR